MTFEEFCQFCSCDEYDEYNEYGEKSKTQVTVIFSSGMIREFSKEFYKANKEVAQRITMHDLYDYIKEQFNG